MALLTTAQQWQLHQLIEMKCRFAVARETRQNYLCARPFGLRAEIISPIFRTVKCVHRSSRAVNPVASRDDNKIQGSN
jgi:hypothetical protein